MTTYYDLPSELSRLIWEFLWVRQVRYPKFVMLCMHPHRKMLIEEPCEITMRMPF